MILTFLGSWRIPLSSRLQSRGILTSIIVFSALGETINIMTLGGSLWLSASWLTTPPSRSRTSTAIVKQNRTRTWTKLSSKVLRKSQTPAFVSTLSICIVFAPMFLLSGVARFFLCRSRKPLVFPCCIVFPFADHRSDMAKYLLRGEKHDAGMLQRNPLVRLQKRFEAAFERFTSAIVACWKFPSITGALS